MKSTTEISPSSVDSTIATFRQGVRALIFSKDRAMQLDACLTSMIRTCADLTELDISVLYKASDSFSASQYITLSSIYPAIDFISETHFFFNLGRFLESTDYILFVVDDCLFRKPWSIAEVVQWLVNYPEILGFSLRLGLNITHCFSLDCDQLSPEYESKPGRIDSEILTFDWTRGDGDWGYPLEVSSSVYRSADILPLLKGQQGINNPNSLETHLSKMASSFAATHNRLSCYAESVAFCIPFNLVQENYFNRTILNPARTVSMLSWLFDNGYRFDISCLNSFIPNACHADCEIPLLWPTAENVVINCRLDIKEQNNQLRSLTERKTAQETIGARLFHLTQRSETSQDWLDDLLQRVDHYIELQGTEMVRAIGSFRRAADASASVYQEELKKYENQALLTGEYLRTKEARCWELTDEISSLQSYMDKVLSAKNAELQELVESVGHLKDEISAIQSSRTWRLKMALYSVAKRVARLTFVLRNAFKLTKRT
jgi:hypothetical protein